MHLFIVGLPEVGAHLSQLTACSEILVPSLWIMFTRSHQGCGVFRVLAQSRSPSLLFEGDSRLWALSVSSGLLCNFIAVYLIFMQFILQLKLCTLLCTFY